MSATTLFILGLLAFFVARLTHRLGPTPWRKLPLNQKLIGLLAILCALFILCNPEYLAFGFLGDSAFFDLLVLMLRAQLQLLGGQARGWVRERLVRGAYWFLAPAFSYLLLLSAVVVFQDALAAAARWLHRIAS